MIPFSAFILGLAGSIHCIAMCGPIAMALSVNESFRKQHLKLAFIQNIGRIFTYTIMGIGIGFIGKQVAIFRFQQTTSIIVGSMLLGFMICPKRFKQSLGNLLQLSYVGAVYRRLWKPLLKDIGIGKSFLLGTLNGLLPCGLLYGALIIAATTASPFKSGIFMFVFGLGTFPSMFMSFVSMKRLSGPLKAFYQKMIKPLGVTIALLIILRGLGLGIPYVSPELKNQDHVNCCPLEVSQ
ncbi:MAG: sulfite exporter TauE/SafE family protein [Lentisphaeria bacterium]|nr:sulfite exporter TauE/SafE family protein [Lentisphaeria bacterium]